MPELSFMKLISGERLPVPPLARIREALDHIEEGNCSVIACQYGEEIVSILRLCLDKVKYEPQTTEAQEA